MGREIAKTGQASSLSRFSTRPFFMGEPGAHGGDKDERGSGDADQTLLGDEDADRHDGGDGKNGEQQRYRLDPFHWVDSFLAKWASFSSVQENMPIFYRL